MRDFRTILIDENGGKQDWQALEKEKNLVLVIHKQKLLIRKIVDLIKQHDFRS